MGKGVKLGDCLVAIAIVLPVGLLVGAVLGYADRFGLPENIGLLIFVAFAGLAGGIARAVVMRRVRARSTAPRQGA